MGGDEQRTEATPAIECPKAQEIAPCEGSHYDAIRRAKESYADWRRGFAVWRKKKKPGGWSTSPGLIL